MAKTLRQTPKQIRTKKRLAGEDPIDKKLDIEEAEIAGATGVVTKDSIYLKSLESQIKSDSRHPKHHNIQMQAHHIVSEKAVKLAGKGYIDELLLLGYNINNLQNLIFLPSTLQGACHLGVQPHIGNHTAKSSREDSDENFSYNDDDHPKTYHDMVRRQLVTALDKLSKVCPSNNPDAPARAQKRLYQLSLEILIMIAKNPDRARLTNAYQAFKSGSAIGCGGESSIDKKKVPKGLVNSCPVERDHLNNQGRKQKPEGITYVKRPQYQLIPGN